MIRRTDRPDDDFADEIEAHLRLEADQLIEEGVAPDEAMMAARREFGNVTRSRERFYESNRRMWLENLWRDAGYALRQMRRSPISTATIVASLALGIGLNTGIFSLADQALVRALPVRAPEELVQLHWDGRFVGAGMGSVGFGSLLPFPLFEDLRADNDVFADMLARTTAEVHLRSGELSEAVPVEIVSGTYFSALGIQPAQGRLFGEADDQNPDAHPLVVLSFDYWRQRFGGDPGVVGTQVRMNDHPMTIIGVAPEGFRGTDWSMAPSLWIPMAMKARATNGWSGVDERRARFSHVFARLAPGVSREHAAGQLRSWFKNYLRSDTEREGWPAVTEGQMAEYMASELDLRPGSQGQSRLQREIQQPMLILLAATGLIFLLACLNVANLSFARVVAGRRATALRSALGASRWRIVGEQLIESGLLALMGCVFGAVLAPLVSRVVLSFLGEGRAGHVALDTALDGRMLLFAVAITGLTTVLSGAAPALYVASIRPVNALKQQASAIAAGFTLRKTLVVGQFVLALILLIGAGLFSRTLGSLRDQGPGYATTNLMMFSVRPMSDGFEREGTQPLLRELQAAVERVPEVEQVGIAAFEMLTGGGWNNPMTIEVDEPIVTDHSHPMNAVSAGFFESLGTPMVAGRSFDERDHFEELGWDLRSVIVNQAFVERYLSNVDPIGARLAIGNGPDLVPEIQIIGVVQSFRDTQIRETRPQAFFSLWETGFTQGTFYVRTRTSSTAAARSIRTAIARVDPSVTVLSLRTLDDQLDRMLSNERMLATLAGAFAVLATLLAMIGLYAVLSFSAERRTKEMGIRLALGAQRWAAGGLIVREAVTLAAVGLVIALPAVYALGRLVESQLFGVEPLDLPTFASAVGALVVVCLVASVFPARKVGTMDPLVALRSE